MKNEKQRPDKDWVTLQKQQEKTRMRIESLKSKVVKALQKIEKGGEK